MAKASRFVRAVPNEWQKWLDDQMIALAEVDRLPERIRVMHMKFGATKGKTCGNCEFFLRFRQGATYYKCTKTKMTHGAATDWRARWPACGIYQESPNGNK